MSKPIADAFLQFSTARHTIGSRAAPSYVIALDKVNEALKAHQIFLAPNESIWDIRDDARLMKLYDFIKAEQKKPDGGIFVGESSPSYWRQRFCSTAIKEFACFLVLSQRETQMLSLLQTATDGIGLARNLEETPLTASSALLEDDGISIASVEGKTAIRAVQVRQNQNVFREIILKIYRNQCCLTGLPIAGILRASHISAWATDKANRMNPENGLCLSATYDAAFDRHLISLDEDYRLIFSAELKEYCTNSAFQAQFVKYQGKKISMPIKFMPSQALLEKHRQLMPA